jgi:TetR/AcrR family transcriptional regulator
MNQNTQTPERSRGRPVDTDQHDLRTQILDTAEELFADRGYAATSIRHIADVAGVNPALVHYYYGNKRELLKTVMKRVLEPLGQAISELHNGFEASPDKIATLLFSMAAEHPHVPRLMIREVLLPGGEMQRYFIENMAPHLGGALPALLGREKSAGRMRADADPAISALLVMSVCIFPFVARTLAEETLDIGFDQDGIELLNQQITEFLKRGLTQ